MLKDEHTLDSFDDHMPAVHQTHISERKRLGLLVVLFALFHTTIVIRAIYMGENKTRLM